MREAVEEPGAGAIFAMLGQELLAGLVLGGIVEVGSGDQALGQAGLVQQRLELVPEAGGRQLSAQEQRDHLRLAAWPQPPHTQHLAPTSLVHPDVVPQFETGPDVGHERTQVLLRLAELVLHAAQPGTFGEPFFVEHPFASGPGRWPAPLGTSSPGWPPGPGISDQMRGSGSLGVIHWRLMKQKQYSSTPEPSPGARKCSLSTMWLWPPTKGL